MSALPVVLLPVGVDDDALDACLAALDAGTPAGSRVWLADDAQAGPRGLAIIERWLATTALQADYTRRPRHVGAVGHLDDMLRACGDADVIVLSPDAVPAPGWARALQACLQR
ncbi:MAG TPA: glycosyltransferase, partial [Luteimonas sp.]|nr:glycosyltransferase [Luteimonas sp.]